MQESCTTTGSDYVLGLETRIRVQDEMLKEMSRKILELEKLKEVINISSDNKQSERDLTFNVSNLVRL